MVYAYLKAWFAGICQPTRTWTFVRSSLLSELVMRTGSKHGRWIGLWLHGKPTKGMIFKLFVLLSGMLICVGFLNSLIYDRPITGSLLGIIGIIMFAFWGVSEDDLKGN